MQSKSLVKLGIMAAASAAVVVAQDVSVQATTDVASITSVSSAGALTSEASSTDVLTTAASTTDALTTDISASTDTVVNAAVQPYNTNEVEASDDCSDSDDERGHRRHRGGHGRWGDDCDSDSDSDSDGEDGCDEDESDGGLDGSKIGYGAIKDSSATTSAYSFTVAAAAAVAIAVSSAFF
ncbi:hypothetical protein IW150_004620 [Coemansia sp. RSA 2607]|nr:hypothetical protein IW150_004620 [Coemansia sp. RSA 2607]